jgi:hypothetical protein
VLDGVSNIGDDWMPRLRGHDSAERDTVASKSSLSPCVLGRGIAADWGHFGHSAAERICRLALCRKSRKTDIGPKGFELSTAVDSRAYDAHRHRSSIIAVAAAASQIMRQSAGKWCAVQKKLRTHIPLNSLYNSE